METNNFLLKKYIDILEEYYNINAINTILNKWNESHRYYHNINHLLSFLKQIEEFFLEEEDHMYMSQLYKNFIIAAFFHDVIYDTKANNNEDKCIEFFNSVSLHLKNEDKDLIIKMIESTKSRLLPEPNYVGVEVDFNVRNFWKFDNNIILNGTIDELIDYENKIFKEFQFVSYDIYKTKRIEFLKGEVKHNENINFLISYINNRIIKVGIYSGSFNPFHLGHLDVLNKASLIFDKVIVAYGNNPEKGVRMIEVPTTLNYYQVDTYNGLVTDYISSVENNNVDVTFIRGLRNGADLDYESNQLSFIKDIKSDVKVVYIPCDKKYEHISSSAIRNLEKFDKELANKYLVK